MEKNSHKPPQELLPEHLAYLDNINKEGNVNMFGAAVYLIGEFPALTTKSSREILRYWMATFKVR